MARGGAAKEAANDTIRTELKTVVDNRTVGEILTEARVARGMDYADVAAQLRIRRTYIEAIEEGRLGDLPGSTYAIGFVRTYAEMMDLDVPKVVAKFKQEAAEFEDRTQLVFPEPMPGSRGPTVSVIVIAVLMLAGAYAGWLYVSNKDRETIELVPPLPEALTKLLSSSTVEPTPAVPAAQDAAGDGAESAVAPQVVETPQVAATAAPEAAMPEPAATEQPTIVNETIASAPVTETVNQAETAAETASATPETVAVQAVETVEAAVAETPAATQQDIAAAQVETAAASAAVATEPTPTPAPTPAATEETTTSEATTSAATATETVQQAAVPETDTELPTVGGTEPSVFGAETGASRIVIRATSPAWVEITAAGGEVLLNRLLRVGDTFKVPDQPGITLVTGSAGGLEFTVDGKVAPPIGAVGDVRRDVVLEPDALLNAQ